MCGPLNRECHMIDHAAQPSGTRRSLGIKRTHLGRVIAMNSKLLRASCLVGVPVVLGLLLLNSRRAESSHLYQCDGMWAGGLFGDETCYAWGDWHVSIDTHDGAFNFHFHGDTDDEGCFNRHGDIRNWCPYWVREELYYECGVCIEVADTHVDIDHHGHVFLKCAGYASPCDDTDSDEDGVPDALDHCPGFDDSIDTDSDGIPDACDPYPTIPANAPDSDGDGVPDVIDNCPFTANPNQADTDGDGVGDACDVCPGYDDTQDTDSDGIPDACDPYPTIPANATDSDGDGVPDVIDNCPFTANPSQADSDGDGVGDACDVCPGYDDNQDTDSDGTPDACDPAPLDPSIS